MVAISGKEFRQLSDLIRMHSGICLRDEKQSLLTGRLNNVLVENKLDSFSEYYDYIISDKTGTAIITLIDKITTNHTFFMREVDHFNYFRDNVLPYLIRNIKDGDMRLWSAGCSTGEEPYTLAMIIDEFLGYDKKLWDSKILATDISSRVLETAHKGIYLNDNIAPLPISWKLNYFQKIDGNRYCIVDKIKDEVIFKKFNLMVEDYPFKKKFHVIFCRNVTIYFDNDTKVKLINQFYDCIEPGGYLFLGHSESLNRNETKFKYVMPAIYTKT